MTQKSNVLFGLAALLLLTMSPSNSFASDSKYRLGLQGAQFAAGISGIAEISNPWALQGIVDVGGDAVAFRLLNRFTRERFWNAYGSGTVGFWDRDSYRPWGWWGDNALNDNHGLGLGVGLGIEYDWRGIDRSLPPLGWNIELGASLVPGFYLDLGIGLHWMF
ncbi:hypothetical protein KQI63_01070 [bacterium]|nr:hypothetical protein [bacterium]